MRQLCIYCEGPKSGKMDTLTGPEGTFRTRVEGGWYAPSSPPTYQDTQLMGCALELFWTPDRQPTRREN